MGAMKVWDGSAWKVVGGDGVAPGTMMLYPGEVAPMGWFIANGNAFDRGANPGLDALLVTQNLTGNLPYRPAEWPAAIPEANIFTAETGFTINSQSAIILPGNLVKFEFAIERTGAGIALNSPDHSNTQIASLSYADYWPEQDHSFAAVEVRHVHMGAADGSVTVTAGLNDSNYTNSNINNGQVITVEGLYARKPPTTAPRLRWIIKGG